MAVAANRFTTTELLTSIKLKGHIPSNQAPFTDANLMAIGDDEIDTILMEQIKSTRENYYLTSVDLSVTSDGVYPIPLRAIGGGLALAQIVSGSMIYPITRSELSEQFSTVTSASGFYGFQLSGNNIKVLPLPTSGVVRLSYYCIPNKMVATTAAAQITAVSSGTLTFAAGTIPSTITTNSPCDIIKDQPGFDWWNIDLTPSSVSSTQIVFSSVNSNVAVGDWVALAGQSPVPQIPVEFRPLLVQRIIQQYYESQGYTEKLTASQAKLSKMEKAVFGLINPRVAEAPKRIVADGSLIGGNQWRRRWQAT